jgi:hypothetical protein
MKLEKFLISILIPDYKEINLFQFSIVFLFLFITNPDLRSHFEMISIDSIGDFCVNIMRLLALALYFIGAILCIGNALTYRKKPVFNKWIVLCFAVFINFFIAVITIKYLQGRNNDLLLIFPGLNLVHACCIVLLWRAKMIRIDSVSDDDATLPEVAMSFIIIMVILVMLQYRYNNYWAITFTISITYSVMLNNNIVALIQSVKNINSKRIFHNRK